MNNKLEYIGTAITFREIPDEVCLAISICNCPYKCQGCHSPEMWGKGKTLDFDELDNLISQYPAVTCILFMGDGGSAQYVLPYAEYIKSKYEDKYKIGLYTGQNDVKMSVFLHEYGIIGNSVDYVKVGRWREDCGPLEDTATNQALYKITVEQIPVK